MKRTTPAPKMPKIDLAAAAKVIKGYVPGAVLERVAAGLDTSNRPFDPYSTSYREFLAKGGEDQRVDLRLTSGMLNTVKERHTVITSDSVTVTIAPDTGSSQQVKAEKGRMKRTGKAGPPHNVVGAWIHEGTARMPPRPWLGLAPDQEKELREIIAAVVIKA